MPLNNGKQTKFYFYPSRYLMGLLMLIHAAALLCVLVLPLQWWAYLLIGLVLFVSLIYYIERLVRYRLKSSIRCIEQNADGSWQLQQRQSSLRAKLSGESVVTRFVLVLNFDLLGSKKKQSVVVFKDSLQPREFYQLKALCLIKK